MCQKNHRQKMRKNKDDFAQRYVLNIRSAESAISNLTKLKLDTLDIT